MYKSLVPVTAACRIFLPADLPHKEEDARSDRRNWISFRLPRTRWLVKTVTRADTPRLSTDEKIVPATRRLDIIALGAVTRDTETGLDNRWLKAQRNWPTKESSSILFTESALPRGKLIRSCSRDLDASVRYLLPRVICCKNFKRRYRWEQRGNFPSCC